MKSDIKKTFLRLNKELVLVAVYTVTFDLNMKTTICVYKNMYNKLS
jgi:hypothetical protein